MESVLVDSHKRSLKKLRVSLLDNCNFRCIYCMPENAVFTPKNENLPYSELVKIIKNLVSLGISEVRLTGGEPTLSPDFLKIVRALSDLRISKLALTTNGLTFKKYISEIANTNLKYVNFSLDTLDPEKFKMITKVDGLNTVIEAIKLALAYELKVKLNVVVMKGVNDDELLNFVKFSQKYNIPVRFLEAMNIGVVKPHFERWFLSAKDMRAIISKKYSMLEIPSPKDSTSSNYLLSNKAQIGFIASESEPFCGGCSRLRIDAKGVVYPCLFKHEGKSLVGKSFEEYPDILPSLINEKPIERIKLQKTPMYQLGG